MRYVLSYKDKEIRRYNKAGNRKEKVLIIKKVLSTVAVSAMVLASFATNLVVPTRVSADPVASTTVITPTDLSISGWFFYNDVTDTIDNSQGSFVTGPATPPLGTDSVQISVTGTERPNLATYQFFGTPLSSITKLRYSTYNPSLGNGGSSNRSAYLQFNVDFDGSDTWQKRLIFVPNVNGTVTQDVWKEWDAINSGNALWSYSGAVWPTAPAGPNIGIVGIAGTTARTWNEILQDFPGVRIRVSDPFLGMRVGEPYPDGYTENIDKFVFGTADVEKTFNFEKEHDEVPGPDPIPCGRNIVVNGSFETPVVSDPQLWDIYDSGSSGIGWQAAWRNGSPTTFNTVTRPAIAKIELQRNNVVPGWLARHGKQYTELDSDWDGPNGSLVGEPSPVRLYQNLVTIPGKKYHINFWTAPRPGTGEDQNDIEFVWSGAPATDFIVENGSAQTINNWKLHHYLLTATGSSTTITFIYRGIQDSLGSFLDNVSVEQQCKEEPEEPADDPLKIIAYKVICDTEADLPNWGKNGTQTGEPSVITATTAADYIAAHSNKCELGKEWNFQWGYADKTGQQGVDMLPGNFVGPGTAAGNSTGMCSAPYCGPNTNTGSAYNNWHTFDSSTSSSGNPAQTQISDLKGSSMIWVREVLPNSNYVPFSVPPPATFPGSDVSAEMYCHTDILNYDNYDFIAKPQLDQTYYCVAFNALKEKEVEDQPEDKHIVGQKFHDLDSNGVNDPTDPGLANWTIYAGEKITEFDVDSTTNTPQNVTGLVAAQKYFIRVSGQFDAGDSIDADAMYSERNSSGFWTDSVQSYESYGPTLLDLQINGSSVNWGTFNPAHVYWMTFISSGNPLDFAIYDTYYPNNSGVLNVQIFKVIAEDQTDATGNYDLVIPDGTPGNLVIAEQTQDGWIQTSPITDHYILPANANQDDIDFGNKPGFSCPQTEQDACVTGISGFKFNDVDGNGQWDQSPQSPEVALPNWIIYLDTNDNNALDSGEMFTSTDSNGFYSFSNIPTGSYNVREVPQNGWVQTAPLVPTKWVVNVTNANANHINKNFGNDTDGGVGRNSGPFTLTVEIDAEEGASGQVTSVDGNISCTYGGSAEAPDTGVCTFVYTAGSGVTLNAIPGSGSDFTDTWSNACASFVHNTTCTLIMNSNLTATAHFSLGSVSTTGGGGGGGGGGGSGGGGSPLPTPQVLGIDTGNSNPGGPLLQMQQPQVLGTTLPRTGFPLINLVLMLLGGAILLRQYLKNTYVADLQA